MQNPRERKPAAEQRHEPLPEHLSALTAAIQNGSPQPAHPMPEDAQPTLITRNGMVLVVA